MVSTIIDSEEYQGFRSAIPLQRIIVDVSETEKTWKVYDTGPRHVRCPLICIPPVSGTADVYFKQLLNLSVHGYRVISVSLYITFNSVTIYFCKRVNHNCLH